MLQSVISARTTNSNAQSIRYKEGMAFENKIHKAFKKGGIVVSKNSVKSPDGLHKISDHTFDTIWMESTTHLDSKRKDEFINKRKFVLENSDKYDKFIIFYKHSINPVKDKQLYKFKKELAKNEIQLIDGEAQAICYINFLSAKIGKGVATPIKTAKIDMVDISEIHDNPINREINEKAVANITDSIIKNGFFGAFFVVPRIVDGVHDGYMLFEGHHRKHAYERVLNWGLNISRVVPIINVDWLSTEKQEELGELLIKVNVEYRNWKTLDYIKAQLELANQVGNKDKSFTYNKLLDIKDFCFEFKLGQTMLWYALGPKQPGTHWLDINMLTSGEFRIDEKYNECIDTFISTLRVTMQSFNSMGYQKGEKSLIIKQLRDYLAIVFEKYREGVYDKEELKLRLAFIGEWNSDNSPKTVTELEDVKFEKRYQAYAKKMTHFLNSFNV